MLCANDGAFEMKTATKVILTTFRFMNSSLPLNVVDFFQEFQVPFR